MKKIPGMISLVLALALVFSLAACGQTSEKTQAEQNEPETVQEPDSSTKPGSEFEQNVIDNNYQEAIQLFNSTCRGNAEKEYECRRFLQDYAEEALSDYVSGKKLSSDMEVVIYLLEHINEELELLPEIYAMEYEYRLVKESKDSYNSGLEYLAANKYEDAMYEFSNVIEEDTENYDAAQVKFAEALSSYKDTILKTVREYADKGEFSTALTIAENAVYYLDYTADIDAWISELEAVLTEASTRFYQEKISSAYDSGELVEVLRTYESLQWDDYAQTTADMTVTYSLAKESYISQALENAKKAFGNNKDYEAAIRVLQLAAADYDEDGVLYGEIEKYLAYQPIKLIDLGYTQKSKYITFDHLNDVLKDVSGNIYDDGYVIGRYAYYSCGNSDDSYVVFYLGGEYSKLSGRVYRTYSSLSCSEWEEQSRAEIYGDGVLLYKAPTITQSTYDPIDFEISVTGVRELKIIVYGAWVDRSSSLQPNRPLICMTNLIVQK